MDTWETYEQGFGRAGHYHPYVKVKDVLYGSVAWRTANPETGEETEWLVPNTRDKIEVPSNYASLFVGLAPYTVLHVPKYGQKYVEMPYPPYRDEVETLMKNSTHRQETLKQLLRLVE